MPWTFRTVPNLGIWFPEACLLLTGKQTAGVEMKWDEPRTPWTKSVQVNEAAKICTDIWPIAHPHGWDI